jgi:MFS family permease
MILLYNLLLVGSFISALTLAIIAPFFPPLAEQNGLSTDTIGLILSANPFGAVIASLLLGYFLNKVSNRSIK